METKKRPNIFTNKGTQICAEVCHLLLIHFWNKKITNIFSLISFNFELGNVTIVADEQKKAHKYALRFATFFDTFLKKKSPILFRPSHS